MTMEIVALSVAAVRKAADHYVCKHVTAPFKGPDRVLTTNVKSLAIYEAHHVHFFKGTLAHVVHFFGLYQAADGFYRRPDRPVSHRAVAGS